MQRRVLAVVTSLRVPFSVLPVAVLAVTVPRRVLRLLSHKVPRSPLARRVSSLQHRVPVSLVRLRRLILSPQVRTLPGLLPPSLVPLALLLLPRLQLLPGLLPELLRVPYRLSVAR